jgi:hypothetical protein
LRRGRSLAILISPFVTLDGQDQRMRRRQLLWCLLFLPLAAGPWLGPRARSAPRSEAAPAGDAPHFKLVGTGSCAGRACHGAIEPLRQDGVRQNEFTIWVSRDPHARAYQVLSDPRSQRLVRNLYGPGAKPAGETPLCLKCHAADPDAPHAATFSAADGVGCESCHGPAERWLRLHALPDWSKKTAQEKKDLGMWPLHSAVERAETCVRCHVGSAAADVNHDLIGAGHPRMEFEFAAYFANLPRHWVEKPPPPGAEAQAWAVGQVVSARAALELLAARAAPSRPWPEFAEYNCFACHHDLRVPWPAEDSYPDRIPGSLPPSSWYRGMPRALAQVEGAADVVASLDEVTKLLRHPAGDREKVEKVAQAARKAAEQLIPLRDRLAKLPEDPAALQKLLAGVIADESGRQPTWDRTAQVYLALAAFDRVTDDKARQAAAALLKTLEFPKGQDSPGPKSSAEDFKKAFHDLDTLFKRP